MAIAAAASASASFPPVMDSLLDTRQRLLFESGYRLSNLSVP
jgi:hypothetical protein